MNGRRLQAGKVPADRQTLRKELKALIASLLEIEDFRDDQQFARDLGADSMMLVELAIRVEERYGFTFPESQLRELRSLDEVVNAIGKLLRIA